MPRKPAKPKPPSYGPNETVQSQFRLGAEALADLDAIAQYLAAHGFPNSRTDAVRYALRQSANLLPKKNPK